MKDFYYILGTDNKATPGELNDAYRKLAQKLQPAGQQQDYFLDNHFGEITEAYITLSDPLKRSKYDRALKKNYQRRLYYFKIGHINVAVMLTLILFTGLFGYYVIESISGGKAKKTVPVNPIAAIVKPGRHKKRHTVPVNTAIKKTKAVTPKIAKAVNQPIPVKADTPVPIRKVQPPPVVIQQPGAIAIQPAVKQPVQGYTATIQANQTGVVNLHQLASYTSAVVANIPNHARVLVLEKGPGFYKVTYGDKTGYVPKWTIPSP
ncbi:MAG: DnaJ domain-containing protein [Bacteroidota bacterium]